EPPRSQIPPPHNRTSSDQYFFSGHIIAILAAILFPVFARAREKARQTNCLSNLKQIALAELMYQNDYDERTAAVYAFPANMTVDNRSWINMHYPYVKNQGVFECPSNEYKFVTYSNGLMVGSYAANRAEWHAGGATNWTFTYAYRSVATFEYPAETMLVADYAANAQNRPGIRPNPPAAPTEVYNANDLHNEGSNVAYFDGHAKWVQGLENMLDPTDVFWSGGK
ncbi:MAG: type II secretion system protein, partial [Armatimonadota bacterium]